MIKYDVSGYPKVPSVPSVPIVLLCSCAFMRSILSFAGIEINA